MRFTILALGIAALTSGCAMEKYSEFPQYAAICQVQDHLLPSPALVGWESGARTRQITATGPDFEDLRLKLALQGAGTPDRPCVSLRIENLAQRRVYAPSTLMVSSPNDYMKIYTVRFDLDSAKISDQGRALLREAAMHSRDIGSVQVKIVGHTDTSGTERHNQKLSESRARAVQAEMARSGLPKGFMTMRGAGERELLVLTPDGVQNKFNRRVEITVQ